MANSPPLSRTDTLVSAGAVQPLSLSRKLFLLAIFCLAQFLDAFNNSAMMAALPKLVETLDMTTGQSTWIISGFQLTFAAFLLISGKISDIYNPKYAFAFGILSLGAIALGSGFVRNKIVLIVLRALAGISASLTIPAALTLLVRVFPEPAEQARAIGVFGGTGAIGGVLGLVIGAIFVEFASWRWVFWFVTIVAVPIFLACMFLVPPQKSICVEDESGTSKIQRLDLPGVSALTAALILFIFAVTSGSDSGWGSATVLAPLLISVAMVAGFFIWEAQLPVERAAIPSQTWFYTNFSVLFSAALLPYFWWFVMFELFTTLWQEVYQWSVISAAVRMIPIGVSALFVSFTGSLLQRINPKWNMLAGHALLVAATILLAFADAPHKYWSHVFPAFIIGSSGSMLVFISANVAIFRSAPVAMTGVVGAIFNAALQLGSAVGIAAVTSIQASVDTRHGGPVTYRGRRAGLWFVLAVVCAIALAIFVFFRDVAERATATADTESKDLEEKIPEVDNSRSESTIETNVT